MLLKSQENVLVFYSHIVSRNAVMLEKHDERLYVIVYIIEKKTGVKAGNFLIFKQRFHLYFKRMNYLFIKYLLINK